MPFCTKCGHEAESDHRFCNKCGFELPGMQETEKSELKIETEKEKIPSDVVVEPKKTLETYSVDRKIQFDDGMLVLTSSDLILYSSNEKDELKRIPISQIDGCSYSMLKRGLVVKKKTSQEENLEEFLDELQKEIDGFDKQLVDIEDEIGKKYGDIEHIEKEVKKAEYEEEANELGEQIDELAEEIEKDKEEKENIQDDKKEKENELRNLESDSKKIEEKKDELADIENEVFKLPKNFSSEHSIKDEYKIWEYLIKRRLEGIPKLKISSDPYDAIVVINDRVFGTTPLEIDLPIIDEAILNREYDVELLKEAYEPKSLRINTSLGKSTLEDIKLTEAKESDSEIKEKIKSYRKETPDRSIDLSGYKIEKEYTCKNEVILITDNSLLVVSKDKKNFLFEISLGMLKKVKYNKGFFGDKSIEIVFDERGFDEQFFKTWIDNKDDKISDAEVKQYSESLVDNLNRKMRQSRVVIVPRHTHAKEYYFVTERDIKNNFNRFNPEDFEHLIEKLFQAKGYKAEVTQYQGDFGVDVFAESGSQKVVIQVKHWKNNVGSPDVQKTLGSMFKYKANQAIVITSSDFTNQAYEVSGGDTPLELWNKEKVQQEIQQYLLK